MPFYLDDIPAEPFVIEPPETIDLAAFTAAEARLIDPAGVTVDLTASIDEETNSIVAQQPAVSPYTVEGVHRLRVAVTSATGRQQLPDIRLVVQDADSQWHTLDSVRAEWPDAEHIADATLWALLDLARTQVVAFAPALVDEAPVPDRYREGQRVQARNVWNATRVAPDGSTGQDDFIIRPFPMDWHVKSILRPKRGIPVIG